MEEAFVFDRIGEEEVGLAPNQGDGHVCVSW